MRPLSREVEFSATATCERVMVITRSLRSVVERYLRNVDYVAQDMLRKLAVIDAEAVALDRLLDAGENDRLCLLPYPLADTMVIYQFWRCELPHNTH